MRTAIEQDLPKLMMKRGFNFNLADQKFVKYFQDRTGYMITQCQCGWDEVVKLITKPPDEIWWITRAKVQDCWELYTQK